MCVCVGWTMDKLFNAKKSSLFKIGPTHKDQIEILKIGEQDIEWADSLRYLGVYFVLARVMTVDITVQSANFMPQQIPFCVIQHTNLIYRYNTLFL